MNQTNEIALEQLLIKLHQTKTFRTAKNRASDHSESKYYAVVHLTNQWVGRNTITFGPFTRADVAVKIRNKVVSLFAVHLPTALADFEYRHTPRMSSYVGLYKRDNKETSKIVHKTSDRRAYQAEWRAKNKWRLDEYRKRELAKRKQRRDSDE